MTVVYLGLLISSTCAAVASFDGWIRRFQQYAPRRTSFPHLNRDSHLVMRGNDLQQAEMWRYISPEERVPHDRPLRPLAYHDRRGTPAPPRARWHRLDGPSRVRPRREGRRSKTYSAWR